MVVVVEACVAVYDPLVGDTAPWYPQPVLVAVLLVLLAVLALLLLAFAAYKWRSKRQAGSTETAGPRRLGVSWQAGR